MVWCLPPYQGTLSREGFVFQVNFFVCLFFEPILLIERQGVRYYCFFFLRWTKQQEKLRAILKKKNVVFLLI